MKKPLLFLFILFQISAQAQTSVYHPFPDSNAVWNIDEDVMCWIPPFGVIHYSIIMDGDTTIAGSVYHKLNIPFVDNSQASCFSGVAHYCGSVRQDIGLKRVYIIPPNDSVEQVLYDFNLNVGDTVPGYLESWNIANPDTVVSIDSILVGNNYRKRWLICPNYNIYIIEGVGSSYGLIEPSPGSMAWDFPNFDITCFKQNDTTLYPNSNFNCDLIDGVSELPTTSYKVTLSPNPLTSESILTIESSSNLSELSLSIYNSLGEIISTKKIQNYSTIIRKGDLSEGIYFYRISRNGNRVAEGKLVLQ